MIVVRAAAFGLMMVLAWHGAGVPTERGDGDKCACERAEALAPDTESERDDADGERESCPPDCDGCACCGVVPMIATVSSTLTHMAPVRALPHVRSMEADAPAGEPSGVFRPPRS